MKRITLIRHAKSRWKDTGLSDFDRPLNKRGKRDAPVMGKRLATEQLSPDLMISSPAKRALITARIIAEEIGYPVSKISLNERVYEADMATLLALVKSLDNSMDHVILFGHNPGFTSLCNFLTPEPIDNVPTCGIVHINLKTESWKDVTRHKGEIIEFDYPKKIS